MRAAVTPKRPYRRHVLRRSSHRTFGVVTDRCAVASIRGRLPRSPRGGIRLACRWPVSASFFTRFSLPAVPALHARIAQLTVRQSLHRAAMSPSIFVLRSHGSVDCDHGAAARSVARFRCCLLSRPGGRPLFVRRAAARVRRRRIAGTFAAMRNAAPPAVVLISVTFSFHRTVRLAFMMVLS